MMEGNKKRKEREIKIINKYVNKNEVEEPRFQMSKFKLEKDLSDSRAKGLIEKDLLFLL